MTTKGRLAEQILRLYNGGDISVDHSITLEDVMLLVTQSVNRHIKKEYYTTHWPLGEAIPPRAAIATYEDIAVVPYGTVTSGIQCTTVDSQGFYVYWDTGGGQFWDTGDGGLWAVQIEDVGISITRAVVSAKIVYSISISNLTYPDTLTYTEVETFINACDSGATIKFNGFADTIPNTFIKVGMSNIVVGATTIAFDYTPEDTSAASSVIRSYAETTHNLLASILSLTTYTSELNNISCCEDTDNTATLLGKVALPAQPINLPNGMGVWKIYSKAAPHSPYIPIPTGLYAMASATSHNTLAASLDALTCYEVFSNTFALFNQSTAELPSTVDIQLVVVDPDQIGEYELLPVPPEMEPEIIRECLELLGAVPAEDNSADNNSRTR